MCEWAEMDGVKQAVVTAISSFLLIRCSFNSDETQRNKTQTDRYTYRQRHIQTVRLILTTDKHTNR